MDLPLTFQYGLLSRVDSTIHLRPLPRDTARYVLSTTRLFIFMTLLYASRSKVIILSPTCREPGVDLLLRTAQFQP